MSTYEIRGTGFANKGALLLFHAVHEQIQRRDMSSRIVVRPKPRTMEYEDYSRFGVRSILENTRWKLPVWRLLSLIPAEIRAAAGLVRRSEVDVVLDASGYGLGDPWGKKPAIRLLRDIRRMKAVGGKFILLPQSFGPFSDPKLRRLARQIACEADMVFPRDESSSTALRDVGVPSHKLRVSPDFTCLLDSSAGSPQPVHDQNALIVPSIRLIQHAPTALDGTRYLQMLGDVAKHLSRGGYGVSVLVHDDLEDEMVAENLARLISPELPIISEGSALAVRELIGNAQCLVGSRYHALVSALTQGVPVVATSWSAKYGSLLKDFRSDNALIHSDMPSERLHEVVDLLIERSTDASFRQSLIEQARAYRRASSAMWDTVFSELTVGGDA